MANHICRGCGVSFSVNTRGRPPSKCATCKDLTPGETPSETPSSLPKPVRVAKPIRVAKPNMPNSANVPSSANISTDASSDASSDVPAILTDVPKHVYVISVANSSVDDNIGTFPYEIVVTNLGFAYRGSDPKEADTAYEKFIAKSIRGFGQIGQESVRYYDSGVMTKDFVYSRDMV